MNLLTEPKVTNTVETAKTAATSEIQIQPIKKKIYFFSHV
jgi:hypothetical protein